MNFASLSAADARRAGVCTAPAGAGLRRARHAFQRAMLALSWLLLAQFALPAAMAAPLAPIPSITARVTDQTGTLSDSERATLEQTLQAFETRKGSQLLVLIVASTAPESIEEYALRVVEKIKPGRKKVDDGALLLVAKTERTMRIEVGYGLEGALNDAVSKRIISEIITPRFQRGDYYGGINAGAEQMIKVIDGEALPPPAKRGPARRGATDESEPGWQSWAPVLFLLALVVGRVLRAMFGRLPGSLATGGVVLLLAWLLLGALSVALAAGVLATMLTLTGGRMGGYLLGGMGGRGGGFGGGGGFSGGGGGFGGGGASGRW